MYEEEYTIVEVSTPQSQEEKNKVTKAQVVTKLQVGAAYTIGVGILSTLGAGVNIATDNLLTAIFCGVGLICSGISAYNILSFIPKYQQSNLDSSISNTESEARTR